MLQSDTQRHDQNYGGRVQWTCDLDKSCNDLWSVDVLRATLVHQLSRKIRWSQRAISLWLNLIKLVFKCNCHTHTYTYIFFESLFFTIHNHSVSSCQTLVFSMQTMFNRRNLLSSKQSREVFGATSSVQLIRLPGNACQLVEEWTVFPSDQR